VVFVFVEEETGYGAGLVVGGVQYRIIAGSCWPLRFLVISSSRALLLSSFVAESFVILLAQRGRRTYSMSYFVGFKIVKL